MAIPRHRRRGKRSSVVQRHRLPACAAIRVKRHRVFVRRPERIERNSRVSRIECAKVIHLRPAITGGPARLRIAVAREQRNLQRQGDIVRLRRRLLRSAPVRPWLIHNRVCIRYPMRVVCHITRHNRCRTDLCTTIRCRPPIVERIVVARDNWQRPNRLANHDRSRRTAFAAVGVKRHSHYRRDWVSTNLFASILGMHLNANKECPVRRFGRCAHQQLAIRGNSKRNIYIFRRERIVR